MRRPHGFILLDSLMAFLALALALSPLLLLQAQARAALTLSRDREQALLFAVSLSEQLRSRRSAPVYVELEREASAVFRRQCRHCSRADVWLRSCPAAYGVLPGCREIVLRWHDPAPQQLNLLAQRHDP